MVPVPTGEHKKAILPFKDFSELKRVRLDPCSVPCIIVNIIFYADGKRIDIEKCNGSVKNFGGGNNLSVRT